MIFGGVDPGKHGAMVQLSDDDSVQVFRVPLQGKDIAWEALWDEWTDAPPAFAASLYVLERVSARPGQGVTSMFNFGHVYGFMHSIALHNAANVQEVAPQTWKAHFGLLGKDKKASIAKAKELIPALAPHLTRASDDGVAEAGLMALYAKERLF